MTKNNAPIAAPHILESVMAHTILAGYTLFLGQKVPFAAYLCDTGP